MCGIYGRVGERDDALDLAAVQSLHHRGPDAAGLYLDTHAQPPVALGHTRLSIQDLSDAGRQPMATPDGALVLVFNGEIYNFQSLRRQLERDGCQFQSHSDTEVILHLYARHGDAMLRMLEGMFAIALWDRPQQRLLLARDPSGIKPLFWRQPTPQTLVFASEIKALLVDPGCPRTPDLHALAGYLGHLYLSTPRTPFANVHHLRPGHALVLQAGRLTESVFATYQVAPKLRFGSMAEATDALDVLLREVVAEHMVADVPVGAFLSGGVDSSVLVALMQQLRRESGATSALRTFTVGFGAEGGGLDETAAAAEIARALGVAHEIIRVDAQLAVTGLSHVVEQFDAPFGNPTALMTDVLCRQARLGVTVAVTGDGGDEAFGGYPRYRATWALAALRGLPEPVRGRWLQQLSRHLPEGRDDKPTLRRIRRFLGAASGPFAHTYRDWLSQYPHSELGGLLSPEAVQKLGAIPADFGATLETLAGHAGDALLDQACLADVGGFLPDNVLALSDRMSMRHALELRVPFADRRVVDFGLRLPVRFKSTPAALVGSSGLHASKRVLRLLAQRYVPAVVTKRPKQGFVAPMGAWLAGPLAELTADALAPHRLAQRGLVRPELVARMQAEHQAGHRDHTWHLWSLVVLEHWFQLRVDKLELPDRHQVQVRVDVAES